MSRTCVRVGWKGMGVALVLNGESGHPTSPSVLRRAGNITVTRAVMADGGTHVHRHRETETSTYPNWGYSTQTGGPNAPQLEMQRLHKMGGNRKGARSGHPAEGTSAELGPLPTC